MLERHVAYFVAYHAQHLIVTEQIHKAAVDPHAAIGAGKGIYLLGFIYLEVERETVHIGKTAGQVGQPLAVAAGGRAHFVLRIHLNHRLAHIRLNLFVRYGERLYSLGSSGEGKIGIDIRQNAAGGGHNRHRQNQKNSFHTAKVRIFS